MKKSLTLLLTVLACSSALAFAGNNHEKNLPSPKSEHELTVGNDKAAGSGGTADDKTVKEEKAHTNKGKAKANGHDKK